MTCHNCQTKCKKFGKDSKGNQRFRCNLCRKTFSDKERLAEGQRLPIEKALLCLNMLVEGSSIRSIERLTGVHRDTIIDLLVMAGERCEQLFQTRIKNVPVKDVQCDELWCFVGMKKKTVKRQTAAGTLKAEGLQGDAWTFVAFERESKLILAWHLGRRTVGHTVEFAEKLYEATDGHFQLTTDAFAAYKEAMSYSLGTRTDYGQLTKIYQSSTEGSKNERRYSPSKFIKAVSTQVWGAPNPEKICTSHVERQNLNIRMAMRRFTRLTNAFSKKWDNLRAALAFYFAWYNFCRIHSSIRCTPAMEAGLTGHIWTLKELLTA